MTQQAEGENTVLYISKLPRDFDDQAALQFF